MKSAEIDSLYARYCAEVPCQLNSRQFGTMVMFFPSLLVIASDGEIDQEEKLYIDYLAKFMADTFKHEAGEQATEKLQQEYYQQLNYLLGQLKTWEHLFVQALGEYVLQHPEMQHEVLDILHLFAQASEGESADEKQKIDVLKEQLHL